MADFTSLDIQEELIQRIEAELGSFLKCAAPSPLRPGQPTGARLGGERLDPQRIRLSRAPRGFYAAVSCTHLLPLSHILASHFLLPHAQGARARSRQAPAGHPLPRARQGASAARPSPSPHLPPSLPPSPPASRSSPPPSPLLSPPLTPTPTPHTHNPSCPPCPPGGLHPALGARLLPPQGQPQRVHDGARKRPPSAPRRE